MRWRLSWPQAKDVILTAAGLTVIGTQVPAKDPSVILLGVALALIGTPLAQATHKVITAPVTGPGSLPGEPRTYSSLPPSSSGSSPDGTSEMASSEGTLP